MSSLVKPKLVVVEPQTKNTSRTRLTLKLSEQQLKLFFIHSKILLREKMQSYMKILYLSSHVNQLIQLVQGKLMTSSLETILTFCKQGHQE